MALHEAGAGLLLGSDAPQVFNVPGFSLHHELHFMVESGLTPFEAIATGTTAVAKFLGTNAGSIEIGRTADLVLLDADPLADISNTRRVHGVMLRGAWHSSRDLESRLSGYLSQGR
jgi:imidazolonepropionase-like amidohydrolase